MSRADPRSNVTIEQKGQTHGKTQQG
ncbi:hypothetical protein RB2654_14360 [Rhodobacterales bacterium HTCC2654]|uniref:Uncharacterized protein n=1 Tax=Maritimibacter alkaliphilus HTCC2654 TaxID=314271 RepID=A3VGS1_9RHOB|nr:hypothetical protein RB2654_14360 [Rhodobacterales bacterium HTCC2654] [Maritimibacter alkaliphilus HTCC2654]